MNKIFKQFRRKGRGTTLLVAASLFSGCMNLSQNSVPQSMVGQGPSTAQMNSVPYGGQQASMMQAPIMQASYQQPMNAGNMPPQGFYPRQYPVQPAGYTNRQFAEKPSTAYPDEYLFDGGDRAKPIHYDDLHRLGLDTEDTVVEYTDHEGNREVKPTNSVAIYSPRFAALRVVSSPADGTSIEKLGSLDQKNMGSQLYNRDAVASHHDNMQVNSARMRARPSALGSDSMAMSADKTLKPNLDHSVQSAYLNLQFVLTGRVQQTEEAMLATAIDSALVWSRSLNPVAMASNSQAQEVQTTFYGAEMIGIDESHKRKGDLRIVKLADKKTAQPGDVITFTIRYDNLGDRELKNIRIVDNLTPRLEYIEDSAKSDRDADFVMEDNGEGSLVLKFNIDKPLKGQEGGVVTFQAKVR